MRNLTDILRDLSKEWVYMDDSQKGSLAKSIAGTRQYTALTEVLNSLADEVDNDKISFDAMKEKLEDCNGAASEMADTMLDNLAGDIQIFNSAVEGFGIALFEYFDGPLRSVVQFATDFISGITDELTPQRTELDEFISSIDESNEKVGDLLSGITEREQEADTSIATLERYKEILVDTAQQEDLTEKQKWQLKNAVSALSDEFPELLDAYDEETGYLDMEVSKINELINAREDEIRQNAIRASLEDSFTASVEAEVNAIAAEEAYKEAVEEANKLRTRRNELMDQGLSAESAMQIVEDEYGESLAEVSERENEAREALELANEQKDEAEQAYNRLTEAVDEYTESEGEAGTASEDAADQIEASGEVVSGTSEAYINAQDEIMGLIESYRSIDNTMREVVESQIGLTEDMSDAYISAGDTVKDAQGNMVDALDNLKQEMQDSLDSQIQAVETWSTNLAELAEKGVSEGLLEQLAEMGPEGAKYAQALNDMSAAELEEYQNKWETLISSTDVGGQVDTALDDIATALVNGSSVLTDTVNELGIDVVQGMITGIEDAQSQEELEDAVEGTGNAIIEKFREALDTHSPSKETEKIGEDVDEGLIKGIAKNKKDVSNKTTEVAESIKDTMSNIITTDAFSTIGKNITDGVSDGITSGSSTVMGEASSFANSVMYSITQNANGTRANEIGYNVAVGFANGISRGESQAIQAAVNMASRSLNAAKSRLRINSPSKEFEHLGEFSGMGYAKGFTGYMDTASKEISESMVIDKSAVPSDGAVIAQAINATSGGNNEMYAEIPVYIGDEMIDKKVTKLVVRNMNNQTNALRRASGL